MATPVESRVWASERSGQVFGSGLFVALEDLLPVVRTTILDPSGTPIPDALVLVTLYASASGNGHGYNPATDSLIHGPESVRSDAAGLVSVTLAANSLLEPDNTYYTWVAVANCVQADPEYIVVPNGAGPYDLYDVLVTPPATLDPLHESAADPHPAYVLEAATPGGELGGTYAVPTVDATHSGSTHAATQAAAEAAAAAALVTHAGTPHAGGGGVTDADFLVGTAHAGLSAEIVVGATPGGELGGTWASPTVDATHSGSTHAAAQAAAEATAAAALSAHEGAGNPHPGYLTPAEGNAAYEAVGAAAAAIATHDDASAHGIADTSLLETISGAAAQVETHRADTTNIHGITDTSDLARLAIANTFVALQTWQAALAATVVGGAQVAGDTVPRLAMRADGGLEWGPGSGAADTILARTGAARLGLTGGLTLTGTLIAPDGAAATPSVAIGEATSGFYRNGAADIVFSRASTPTIRFNTTGLIVGQNKVLGFSTGDPTSVAHDLTLARFAAGSMTIGGLTSGQLLGLKALTELTTIAAAATTDTTIQLPAGAIILAVTVRVTVVIPTATTFTVGDASTADRFSTAAVSVAANSTDRGTKAGASYQATAAAVRITPNGTPAANTGRVRVTIHYLDATPSTS